jgi:hypothetical protein
MKPDQIKPNKHSVCIKFAVSGINVDVVPVQYEGIRAIADTSSRSTAESQSSPAFPCISNSFERGRRGRKFTSPR